MNADVAHTTAAVLIPPAALWPAIQAIRARHDRGFRRWMPHITLLYPFVPPADLGGAAERCAAACRLLAPFALELARWGRFSHRGGAATIWLAPEPAAPLAALHAALVAALAGWWRAPARPFVPHLSVGQAPDARAAELLIARWQADWAPLRWQAAALALLRREAAPDARFEIAHTLPLAALEESYA